MDTPGRLAALTTAALPPALVGQAIAMPALRPPTDDAEIDLRACLRTLRGGVALVAWTALLFVLVGAVYALMAAPVYEADMLIHVEEDLPNPSRNVLSEASDLFETKKAAIAEMELLRSRVVAGRAVDALRLDIEVAPRYFPVGGQWYASRHDDAPAAPPLGLLGYAWGGERIVVAALELPQARYRQDYTITAGDAGRYHVSGPGIALDGRVGAELDGDGGRFRLTVARLQAWPGTRFAVRRVSRLGAIERLQDAISIAEEGKQSGVIAVKYRGASAAEANAVLGEIGRQYLAQNLARKTEQAEKSLAFLDVQLPALRRQLEQAEARYNQFRLGHATVNVEEEGRITLQNAAAARARLIDLQQKRIELLTHYTSEHPIVQGIDAQLRHTSDEIAALGGEIRNLPMIEQEEARLMRDIKIATDVYTALSNTAQQLQLASVARVSNVRLVDAPVAPERPLKPNRRLILALALVSGMFCGGLLALGRQALRGGFGDADQIEQLLGARVVAATVPHSRRQGALPRHGWRGSGRLALLAHTAPEDPTVDSLRAFRTALQCALPHLRNPVVVLSGPTRGVGTSFLAVNLAALVAAGGKRVLLIDANLRHGRLHRYFDQQPDMGLAEILAGTLEARLAIRRNVLDRLDFIACGAASANRSEYLQQFNFDALADHVAGAYDLVLVDAPPLLAQADALVVSARAGALFLVARAGLTTARQIGEAIKRAGQAGVAPCGIVFNAVAASSA